MSDFSFRIRFVVPDRARLGLHAANWLFESPDIPISITLRTRGSSQPIAEAQDLILESPGYPSQESALQAGKACRDAMMRTLACLGMGADFGLRRSSGGAVFTSEGLSWAREMFGLSADQRILDDVHGLMVFETAPPPRFVSGASDVTLIQATPGGRFERVFKWAISHPYTLSEKERLSLELYNASFFEWSQQARFLLLIMAVEALLDLAPRSENARVHVEHLIGLTEASTDLTSDEKQSLLGSLKWLLDESIGQAGRKLARERLGTRQYMGQSAAKFFTHCYKMRSALVHGNIPAPTQREIQRTAPELELFVSHLLAGPLLLIENAASDPPPTMPDEGIHHSG